MLTETRAWITSIKRAFAPVLTVCIVLCLVLSSCSGSNEEFEPDYDNYNTYAFFGVDSRAADDVWKTDEDETGSAGKPSSDVIMLIRVDDESGDIRIVSVYRDTMLEVSGSGEDFDKCNAAYREYGAYGAIDMLERNLDVRISGYITANFMSVADAIDALGGVEIDVEDEPLTESHRDVGDNSIDAINMYIDEMNRVYDKNTPHLAGGGLQNLSGLQAVAYSRLRYTEGSDLRRAERQRTVLTKMFEKLSQADAQTQRAALKSIYQTIDTDLGETEMMDIFDKLSGFDLGDMEGFPYYKKGIYGEKAYYVPCDLETNVTEFHKRMYGEEEYSPNETVAEYSSKII